MDRARFAVAEAATPFTDSATFTVTPTDVGSQAVRPGIAAKLEEDRALLLMSAKLVLARIQTHKIPVGAAYEYALKAAIAMTEARNASA